MESQGDTTAEELVNTLPEKELADTIFKYGEERFSRGIAKAIVKRRETAAITGTLELAEIVRFAMPAKAVAKQKIHPATRTFPALRIAVTPELDRLERFMDDFYSLLNPGGRLCVLSFTRWKTASSNSSCVGMRNARPIRSRVTCRSFLKNSCLG